MFELKTMTEYYEVIVIGGGHAGLSASYFLKQQNISHLVLEKGRVGETWRSQRWDSFALNTPIKYSMLPGDRHSGNQSENFFHRDEFVSVLENYVIKFQLPVLEHARVIALEKKSNDQFSVEVSINDTVKTLTCDQVIVASGNQNLARIPSLSKRVSSTIVQLHAADYRNASQLPEGNILIVGSAQTGCQIAEDLLNAGRKVFLSSSKVARIRRRYRNVDALEWLVLTRFLDMTTDSITDPAIFKTKQPQVSGVGALGHTVSYQSLAKMGAVILGRLKEVSEFEITFEPNAAEHVHFADDASKRFCAMFDQHMKENEMTAEPIEVDSADEPDVDANSASEIKSLNLKLENITTVIWATGFAADFSYIKVPVLNEEGMPVHHNGISPIQGLYFLGFTWLRSRKSGIIYGMNDDAKFITGQVVSHSKPAAQ